jgi:nucleotide-binding universal stress UspA family protein
MEDLDTMTAKLPPRRLVVVLDLDDRGRRAAQWARAAATSLAVELVALTKVSDSSAEHSPGDEAIATADTKKAALAHLDDEGIEVDDVLVCDTSLDDGAVAVAGEDDLVVIGAHSHEGVTRWALGSRPHDLAKRLRGPFVMVPPDSVVVADDSPVVVGVDGTEANRTVVDWTKAFASGLGRPVYAAYARDSMYDTFDNAGDLGPEERHARVEADSEGLALHERPGKPIDVLRDVAHDTQAFVTVVGAHEEHSLGGALVGNLVDQLMHEPPGPLAVLTHDFLS